MELKARIFDIQRYAVHDGPGIRTSVFFKGCSNRCAWCHNPESLAHARQIQYYPARCISCTACVPVCPRNAHAQGPSSHVFLRKRCDGCGKCAQVCHAHALVLCGEDTTVDDVMGIVRQDRAYYARSGGGLTVSGGEPALQADFCAELLQRAKAEGIGTCVETAGNVPYENLRKLIPHTDLFLYDVKAFSELVYHQYVHGNRQQAMSNLERLTKEGVPIIVRTVVVCGANDQATELEAIARWLAALGGIRHYTLLPYHPLGRVKYDALDEPFRGEFSSPAADNMRALEEMAARYLPVVDARGNRIAQG